MKLRQAGQSSTEYAIMISTIVIAVAAAAYVYVPVFQNGVQVLSFNVSQILADHGSVREGYGVAASSASGGGGVSNPTQGQSRTVASAPAGSRSANTVSIDNADGGGF